MNPYILLNNSWTQANKFYSVNFLRVGAPSFPNLSYFHLEDMLTQSLSNFIGIFLLIFLLQEL